MMVSAMAQSAMGDAYMENGDAKKALSHYKKAAEMHANEFSTPYYLFKAGMACEEVQQYGEAVKMYESVKTDYPKSSLAREMDKYIARAKGRM